MNQDYPKKIFYSISEVAEILGESPSLIRYWSNKFPTVIKPERNKKGNRQFTQKDVENFKLIHHLTKGSGMTLEGAEKRLKENADDVQRKMKAIHKLQQIRDLLEHIADSDIENDENVQ